MTWIGIVNPSAGRTEVSLDVLHTEARLRGLDVEFTVTPTKEAVQEVVAAAVERGERRFLAVGGDGTAHVVANALMTIPIDDRFTLAIVAAGSGSDLVRTFGHQRGVGQGLDRLVEPDLYPIDVGVLEVGGNRTYFLNAANVGVGASSASVAARLPRWFGGVRYIAAFWIALSGYRAGSLDVEIDHHRFTGPAINVVIANGQFFGGGMNIAPRASAADGQFDVQVFSGRKRLAFSVMPRVLRGTHLTHRAVRRYVGSSIEVTGSGHLPVEADGEIIGEGSISVRLLPMAIDLVI